MSIKSFGQVQKPDFAYPATISKTAKADLKKAEDSGDPKAALSALIRLGLADNMIDPASLQSTIKETERVAEMFKDSPESGLYDCLLAVMYNGFYLKDQTKYNRRDLPLLPLPDDLTEWSGKQLRGKVEELCRLALEKREILSQLKIADYSGIITADKLTQVFYPTVFDFVCSEVPGLDYKLTERAAAEGKRMAVEGSPAYIQWLSREKKPWEDPQFFLDSFEKFQDSPAASLLLGKYINAKISYGYEDEVEAETEDGGKPEWFPVKGVRLIDEYFKACPNPYLSGWLKNLRKRMLDKEVTLCMPAMCMPGDTIEVECEAENAQKVTVSLYYIPDADYTRQSLDDKYLKAHSPQAQSMIEFKDELPFKANGKVRFEIKKCGYYIAIPSVGTDKDMSTNRGSMRCVPIYPFAINGLQKPLLAVVNPKDGKPIESAEAALLQTKNGKRHSAKTDANGIAQIEGFGHSQNRNQTELEVKYGGQVFKFNDIYLSFPQDRQKSVSRTTSILTDRGLYHPGDTVKALFVASQMEADSVGRKKGELCTGLKLTAILKNANWETIDTVELVTDEWGRATAEFALPTDGLTGRFMIVANGDNMYATTDFMVSDYKMPDFEIKVASIQKDEPSAGSVTIKGQATYYSGMPVANAEISVNLSKSYYFRWRSADEHIYGTELTTDESGAFSVTFGSDILGDDKGFNAFIASFDATSPSGSSANCQAWFVTGRKYMIDINATGNMNGELPFEPSIKVLDADGNEADIELKWSLSNKKYGVVAQGTVGESIDLSEVHPGSYSFKVEPADTTLAMPAESDILVYNVKSGIAPKEGLWTLKNSIDFTPGKPVEVLIASGVDATVYCITSSNDSLISLEAIDMKAGYKTIKTKMPSVVSDKCSMTLATVRDFNCSTINVNLSQKDDDELKIVGETFRDRLTPGQTETWKFRLTDTQGNPAVGALALDMFNKQLDAIQEYSPSIRLADVFINNYVSIARMNARIPQSSVYSKSVGIPTETLSSPEFNFYGQSFYPNILYSVSNSGSRMYKARAMDMNASLADGAVLTESAVDEEAEAVAGEESPETTKDDTEYDFRDSEVPMAIWAPSLATDDQGNLCYTFTVPNANTTWKLTALAWTKNLKQGSLVREFIASKPIMVAPNTPRFLRQGDVCEVLASVLNNTDSACVATTVVEIFNPGNGKTIKGKTFTDSLEAKGTAKISFAIEAGYDMPAIGYRIRTDNGLGFSDGEQTAIPVLTSMAALVETTPFYLNPGETSYETPLPDDEGAKLTLTFCENPSWTIVTALPGLRQLDADYANNAAAAIFSASVAKGIVKSNPAIAKALSNWKENPSDSALISMIEKNEELKIALLNSTPWVQAAQSESERMSALALIFSDKETDKAISQAISALKKLQKDDGGFVWGQWCQNSSMWTTANVLDMLGQLKRAGWLPKDKDLDAMIAKAVKYYDKEVKDADMMYAVVRRYFPEIPMSINGQASIAKTTADILKNWKKYVNPAYKAFAAEALYLNNYPTKSKELMRSISEFGVMTPSQGLTFPSVNALYEYGQILNAYALILPDTPQVDGLRQQLIVRKQGCDWGSSVVTTEVVSAIINSGSKWIAPANGATITVGNNTIKVNHIEEVTGALKVDISKYSGQTLKISTSGQTPSYGAIFAQFDKKMDQVEASACDDLDIEKSITVRQADGSWSYADGQLHVGDRLKIQLTIHSKRNLQYVEIIDERPAAYQPVDQLPGWLWAEGVGFYRENRDAYTALHVESMRPGTYILTYEVNVGQSGSYSSGVTTIQSQYSPEISAHSSGTTIVVKPTECHMFKFDSLT